MIQIRKMNENISDENDPDIQMKIKKLLLFFICRHIELLNFQN
jgi:hypothetical protein